MMSDGCRMSDVEYRISNILNLEPFELFEPLEPRTLNLKP
jgi:hypothetical protein